MVARWQALHSGPGSRGWQESLPPLSLFSFCRVYCSRRSIRRACLALLWIKAVR